MKKKLLWNSSDLKRNNSTLEEKAESQLNIGFQMQEGHSEIGWEQEEMVFKPKYGEPALALKLNFLT